MTEQWAGARSKLSNESNPIQSLKVILQESKIGHNYANDPTAFVKESIWSKKKEENKKENFNVALIQTHYEVMKSVAFTLISTSLIQKPPYILLSVSVTKFLYKIIHFLLKYILLVA